MNFKNKCKNLGFSLAEILIAIFIVAILALVTLPVINKQLNKTNEYSYYLAYRTVEKLAGQIVALGDPDDDISYSLQDKSLIADNSNGKGSFTEYIAEKVKSNPISLFLASLPDKFAYTQTYILSKFVPKALAASVSTTEQTVSKDWGGWNSDDYDDLWLAYQVCVNNKMIAKKEKVEQITNPTTGNTETRTISTYYDKNSEEDFDKCCGYGKQCTEDGETIYANDNIKELIFEPLNEVCSKDESGTANFIKNQNSSKTGDEFRPDAKAFCESNFKTYCKTGSKEISGVDHNVSISYVVSTDDGDDEDDDDDEADEGEDNEMGALDEGEHFVDAPRSKSYGMCRVSSTYKYVAYETDPDQYKAEKPSFPASWCTSNGYANMTNVAATDGIDCQCKSSQYVVSTNSEKACVLSCSDTSKLPYAKLSYNSAGQIVGATGVCCSTDFNETTGTCCPEKSMYNHAAGKCECISGYKMEGSTCKLESCPPGSHKTDDGVCVVNPPITSAKRLCEEITEQWNISDSACNTFTKSNDFNYYAAVYQAALDKNASKTFLSVNSKIGAFKNITPNIEFSNGLKMWILGDKSASIAGLSFFNPTIKETQNMCHRKKLTTNTAIACYNEGGYFCKNENTCLILDPQTKTSGVIGDARACCSAMDVSDLQSSATGSGDSDAWKKDQRVYGISGFTVFVDINGDKGDGTLWDDVFPFFIGANGVVYPGYPLDAPKGSSTATVSTLLYTAGNSDKYLPVDVYYYLPTDEARQRKVAFAGVSFARGMCSARRISKNTPYCLNLGEKFVGGDGFKSSNCPTSGGCTSSTNLNGNAYISIDGKESRNPCDHYNCFVSVRKKLKSF